jgi:hypothetical protein
LQARFVRRITRVRLDASQPMLVAIPISQCEKMAAVKIGLYPDHPDHSDQRKNI